MITKLLNKAKSSITPSLIENDIFMLDFAAKAFLMIISYNSAPLSIQAANFL